MHRHPITALAFAASLAALAACSSAPSSAATSPSPAPSEVTASSAAPSTSDAPSTTAPQTLEGSLAMQFDGAVHVVDLASGESKTLSSTAPDQEQPDWSPDGSRVVFQSDFTSILVESVATGETTTLFDCSAPCGLVQDPSWSPDGRLVVFTLAETDGTVTTRSLLESIDVATGERRTLYADTSGLVWTFAPRWAPDGKSIVFEETTWASTSWTEEKVDHVRVVVVDVDGSKPPRSLVEWDGPMKGPEAASPDWSPIGDVIVYSRDGNLRTISPDGTGDRPVTDFDDEQEHAIQPTFTPDGTSIVFTYVTGVFGTSDRQNAAIVGLDGTGFTVIAPNATHPRLRPPQA